MTQEFRSRFLTNTDDTGRFIVHSTVTGKTYYVEVIGGAPTNWGDLNPATKKVEGSYGKGRDGGFSGKYQQGDNLKDIIKTWSPDMMLPRAYKDKRKMPTKVEGIKKYE